jgi:hypothetical protein
MPDDPGLAFIAPKGCLAFVAVGSVVFVGIVIGAGALLAWLGWFLP